MLSIIYQTDASWKHINLSASYPSIIYLSVLPLKLWSSLLDNFLAIRTKNKIEQTSHGHHKADLITNVKILLMNIKTRMTTSIKAKIRNFNCRTTLPNNFCSFSTYQETKILTNNSKGKFHNNLLPSLHPPPSSYPLSFSHSTK